MAASKSAVLIDPAVFDPAAITPDVHAFNQKLMDIMKGAPKWYEVGAPKYRKMRANGETPLPATTFLDSAEDFEIPSRDAGRKINCRILKPTNGKSISGVYMHMHGGGWVLQTEASQDGWLQDVANTNGVMLFSVGYRLAPEDPYPAGPNDCFDTAEWLIDNADSKLGAPLKYVGGESAGGHLAMLVLLHLLQHTEQRYNSFRLKAMLLHYGAFDLTNTPNSYLFDPPGILVLDKDLLDHYYEVFLPGMSFEEKRRPSISPLYADLQKLRGQLPPALFTCGTNDPLLDDTIFMSARYQMAGGVTRVVIAPGAAHGYIVFPRQTRGAQAEVGLDAMEDFIDTHQ